MLGERLVLVIGGPKTGLADEFLMLLQSSYWVVVSADTGLVSTAGASAGAGANAAAACIALVLLC